MTIPLLKRYPQLARFRLIWLAPVFALVALLAWALASPMGAGPDDDYHLASTWCANPANTSACLPGSDSTERIVPEIINEAPCYAGKPETSADCQDEYGFDSTPTLETDRGNFIGEYPPVFYAFMSLFVGPDILAAIMAMRIVNVLLFLGITVTLYALLPIERRPTLVWGWLITTIPLGIFLITSNNPSSWAVIGVGSAWLALLGWFETRGKRRITLGALFAVSVLMAAGARGDAALYSIIGIGAVLLLRLSWTKRFWLDAILPIAMTIVAAVFFLTSRQSSSGTQGFGGAGITPTDAVGGSASDSLEGFGLLAYNLLNIPKIWAGVFGDWGLGWLDTSMPAVVLFGSVAVFVAIGFGGLSRLSPRKTLVVLLLALTVWVLPAFVLYQGGDVVGESVQPRYILPLIVLLGGLLMLTRGAQRIEFTRAQLVLVGTTLAVVQFVALHMNLRRYVTGTDGASANLDAGIEWWWDIPISPNGVWILGSLAYAALVFVLLREFSRRSALERELATRSSLA
ncbi:DUF2142 domain-containing protein [Glaciihabitans arcticus]|uniref:DUF2142 domain-containing protein n=1 Tax=Glaciihabitans arcticus TaxID=2668039 RepID=A0A4Q9GS71_9MICO|nr:DUF2142 domain-containing protein [Glaciihabitans arcticus]TBN55947.1 DUF2142 domain-containing protein [Glaciihabitans arcticus]